MTPTERRLRRDCAALLDALESLVILGNLGLVPGANYAEIHRKDLRKAERLVKRIRATLNAL